MLGRLLFLGAVGLIVLMKTTESQPARSGHIASCPSNICSARNDPHMTTFDGKRYENHVGEGEYLMYRHDKLPMRVHALFCECPWRTSIICVCGFGVQSGRAKFALNHKDSDDSIIAAGAMDSNRSILIIEHLGTNRYRVTVPTGTIIEYSPGHLKIKASLEDYKHADGLCGDFDGNCGNDLKLRETSADPGPTYSSAPGATSCSGWKNYPDDFSTSWRILPDMDESLFFQNNGPTPFLVSGLSGWKPPTGAPPKEIFYCSCLSTSSTQRGLFKDIVAVAKTHQKECVVDPTKDITGNIWNQLPKSYSGRKKRQADPSNSTTATIDSESGDVYYPSSEYQGSFPGVPPTAEVTDDIDMMWKNGWTEAKARTFCSQKYNENNAVSKCKSVVYKKLDVATNIEECMLDIQMAGNDESSDVQLHAMLDECKTHYDTSPELWEEPAVVDAIKIVCPDDCSGNGECVEGVCNCNEGFDGDSCTPPPASSSVNCAVSSWGDWGACSETCNTGTQKRSRTVTREKQSGGTCVPLEETRQCTIMLPVHCAVSSWGTYGSCSSSCGSGTQTRSRTILMHPNACGTSCPALSQNQNCYSPVVNCAVSSWSAYGSCSVSCGSGTQTRNRRILTNPNSCGTSCPALTQSHACNTPIVNCAVSSWTPYGSCSVSCGSGTQTRTRTIQTQPNSCGTACPALRESQTCSKPVVNCAVSTWETWGSCSVSCGSGTQTRIRRITRHPNSCGSSCPYSNLSQRRACNTPIVNCRVSSWTSWSSCSNTCNNGIDRLQPISHRTRSRRVLEAANTCGAPCPSLDDFEPCLLRTELCPSDIHPPRGGGGGGGGGGGWEILEPAGREDVVK